MLLPSRVFVTNSLLGRASSRLFKIEHYCISPVIDSAPKELGAKSGAEKLGKADEVGGVECAPGEPQPKGR